MYRDKDYKCWICQINIADSGEHIIKKTDLKHVYGNASQKSPVYTRKDGKKTKPIGSINSNLFKYERVICEKCNNNITQNHDNSWEVLSDFLHNNWDDIKINNGFKLNKIFPSDPEEHMIFVQLFFIKLLGCKIAESGNDFCLKSFSAAINSGNEHPDVYISFRDSQKNDYTASADIDAFKDGNGNFVYLHWFYTIGSFSVDVIYTKNISNINLNGAKKPSDMNDFVSLSKLNYNQDYQSE